MLSNFKKGSDVFYSVLLSVYLLIPAINKIAMVYFPFLRFSLMSVLYSVIGILIVAYFFVNKNRWKEIGKVNFFVFAIVFIYYLSSSILNVTRLSIFEFVVYFAIPVLFFSRRDFDFDMFIKITLIVSALGLPIVNSIFSLGSNGMAEMGVSYAFLLPSIIPIYYLMRHKRKTIIYAVLSILNLVYDIQILLYGSRGCVLSILIVIIMLLIFKNSIVNFDAKLKIRILVIVAILVFAVTNFNSILNLTSQALSLAGISSNSLNKMIMLSQSGDISNGRNEIFEAAFSGFLSKPLFGNGFDSFDFYTGLGYPHNFIIQLLYDLGLVGSFFVFVPLIIGAIRLIKNSSRDSLYLFIVVFCSSVPGALFSQNAWKNVLLWVTISMSFSYFGLRKVPSLYDKKDNKKTAVS